MRKRWLWATKTIALFTIGLWIMCIGMSGPTGSMHMHKHPLRGEPDRWTALVCNAKDQGATPEHTAHWLVKQYGFDFAAAAQHVNNHWNTDCK